MSRWAVRSSVVTCVAFAVVCGGCGRQEATSAAPRSQPQPALSAAAASGDVNALQAEADRLESDARRSPGDAALKRRAATADYQAGHTMMVSDKLDRKVKYRGALRYFRRALVLDPRHAQAQEEKDLIESIYRQMGRPIPE